MRLFSLLIFFVLEAAPVVAQQDAALFGIGMGESVTSLNVAREGETVGIYHLAGVPDPDRDFNNYMVRSSAPTGVCMVTAISQPIISDPDGKQLREEFVRLRTKYAEIFGEPRTHDYILAGDTQLWAHLFATKLQRHEAILAARWTYNNGNVMGDKIMELILTVQPAGRAQGVLVLQAKLNNYRECMRAVGY